MGNALPEWAKRVEPIDMNGAAHVLGVGRRFLVDAIKRYPHYERRGSKKVFYPEHIALLREALSCQTISKSKTGTASGTPLAPSVESAFDKALALATEKEPKNSRQTSRRGRGNVIPMAKKR